MKGWFRGGRGAIDQGPDIEDLIVLERYEEAAERLKQKLRNNPQDLHAHLKLAEVYTCLHQISKAVDEYRFVAEEYASDGFYDKGIALLAKARRLAPADASLVQRMEGLQRAKNLEHSRTLALEGLRAGDKAGTSTLELQRMWSHLSRSPLVSLLPGDQLKRLFSAMKLERLEAGSVVAEKGSRQGKILLVVQGIIEAVASLPTGGTTNLRAFTSGDLVGDGVLLEHMAWPATYRVAERATVLTLTREGLEQALMGNPDPRGLLEALRAQRHDRAVAAAVRRLTGEN